MLNYVQQFIFSQPISEPTFAATLTTKWLASHRYFFSLPEWRLNEKKTFFFQGYLNAASTQSQVVARNLRLPSICAKPVAQPDHEKSQHLASIVSLRSRLEVYRPAVTVLVSQVFSQTDTASRFFGDRVYLCSSWISWEKVIARYQVILPRSILIRLSSWLNDFSNAISVKRKTKLHTGWIQSHKSVATAAENDIARVCCFATGRWRNCAESSVNVKANSYCLFAECDALQLITDSMFRYCHRKHSEEYWYSWSRVRTNLLASKWNFHMRAHEADLKQYPVENNDNDINSESPHDGAIMQPKECYNNVCYVFLRW